MAGPRSTTRPSVIKRRDSRLAPPQTKRPRENSGTFRFCRSEPPASEPTTPVVLGRPTRVVLKRPEMRRSLALVLRNHQPGKHPSGELLSRRYSAEVLSSTQQPGRYSAGGTQQPGSAFGQERIGQQQPGSAFGRALRNSNPGGTQQPGRYSAGGTAHRPNPGGPDQEVQTNQNQPAHVKPTNPGGPDQEVQTNQNQPTRDLRVAPRAVSARVLVPAC